MPQGSYAFQDLLQYYCMSKMNKHINPEVINIDSELGRIISSLDYSDFTFQPNSREFKDDLDANMEFEFSLQTLAAHNSSQPIAGYLTVRERLRPKEFTLLRNGFAIVIPYPRKRQNEFWEKILAFYQCTETQRPVEWVANFITKEELPTCAEESRIQKEISRLESEMTDVVARRNDIRHWYRLVTDQGPELERVVRDWFLYMGAEEEIRLRFDSDGVFRLPDNSLVLIECKGLSKSNIKEEGLDQLLRNRLDIESNCEETLTYSVLCVNFDRDTVPDDRKVEISARFKQRLNRETSCLVDSRVLLRLVLDALAGRAIPSLSDLLPQWSKCDVIFSGEKLGTDQFS